MVSSSPLQSRPMKITSQLHQTNKKLSASLIKQNSVLNTKSKITYQLKPVIKSKTVKKTAIAKPKFKIQTGKKKSKKTAKRKTIIHNLDGKGKLFINIVSCVIEIIVCK